MVTHKIISMPACHDHAVLLFDQTNPRELTQFFDESEYLFDRAAITADAEKKKQLLCYMSYFWHWAHLESTTRV